MIHPTAVVDKRAQLAGDVEVGPYCVIGGGVKVGEGTRLLSHVSLDGKTEVGKRCIIHPFASIGGPPQDVTYKGEETACVVGDNNTIREYVTINRASTKAGWTTKIGNNCFIMAYCHIGHDCIVGSNIIMANAATLGGHVRVDDFVFISGPSAVHQFCRIGESAMISGLTGVPNDIPPFVTASGNRAKLFGLNVIGLERRGFTKADISGLKKAYRFLFRSALSLEAALLKIEEQLEGEQVRKLVDFVRSSERGICR